MEAEEERREPLVGRQPLAVLGAEVEQLDERGERAAQQPLAREPELAPRLRADDGGVAVVEDVACLLYTSPSPRDATLSRMPSSA